ncbi:hypothetical protein HY003_00225 [Candidatus Saccharibacteria bacterium]|nr:hypothetical protein [Candidatus Saccharibacteria bacterium]MBI3337717.1 hypothetical protein [Candidatus Saccharibacteria bacterium]
MDEPEQQPQGSQQTDSRPTISMPVMDIQPSSPTPEASNPLTGAYTAPVDDDPMNELEPASLSPEPAPEQNIAPSYDKPNLSIPELPAHTKTKKPMVAILLIIILVLGLAGAGAYFYMQTNDTAKNTVTPTASTPIAPAAKITSTEVGNTADQVDKTVNDLDDSKDLNVNDLSDASLGL